MKLFLSILLLFINTAFLNASVFKGQREYMRNCKACHGSGAKISQLKTTSEWIEIFSNNAKKLKDFHKNDKKALNYFNSKKFLKNQKHLLDFLKKYSLDSGYVPACSD